MRTWKAGRSGPRRLERHGSSRLGCSQRGPRHEEHAGSMAALLPCQCGGRVRIGMIPWLWAIYVSVLLWLAVAVGNIALFTLRPAEHWPALETIEGLQTASLIPIALLLHRINRRSRQSAVITVAGILGMLLGAVLSFAFASELLTFGTGLIAVFGDTVALVGLLVWLFTTNLLAWRGRALPRNLALLGMAAAITITLLYPVWALWLAVNLRRQAAVR